MDSNPYEVLKKKRDTKFFLANLRTKLYPGSRLSVIEACYVLGMEKSQGYVSDKVVDRLCRLLSEVLLPEGNLHPPSLYLLKKCLKVPPATDFEQHVCVGDCCRFTHLAKHQYPAHRDETCEVCGERRFDVVHLTSGVSIKPRKVFWDLGLARTIKERFFSNPEFCKNRTKGRDLYDTDYYKSEEAIKLDEKLGGAVRKEDNSVWELGADGFQPFTFKTHSSTVVALR
jgi:hypothetical protein